jgi:Asp-tRNA(Asn)/Glu-tRNA(Gln) amidotransferase A subunit family amidase
MAVVKTNLYYRAVFALFYSDHVSITLVVVKNPFPQAPPAVGGLSAVSCFTVSRLTVSRLAVSSVRAPPPAVLFRAGQETRRGVADDLQARPVRLLQKKRRLHGLGSAVHATQGTGTKVQFVHGPRGAHIKKPAFLFQIIRLFIVPGKYPLFKPGKYYPAEFQALCVVQRDKGNRVKISGTVIFLYGTVKFYVFKKFQKPGCIERIQTRRVNQFLQIADPLISVNFIVGTVIFGQARIADQGRYTDRKPFAGSNIRPGRESRRGFALRRAGAVPPGVRRVFRPAARKTTPPVVSRKQPANTVQYRGKGLYPQRRLGGKIKAAGGIILGKLNLTEFANYMTSGMPSGYSSLGGFVLNPYKPWMNAAGSSPVLTPSGSSAGSGAASAAALSAVTIGTETSGSILSPTQANSIVGIKPTVGLVSRTGVVPLSSTQDTAGPMGRSVADVAALLTVVAAYDPADVVTAYGPDILPDFDIDYTRHLDPDGLRGKRVGLYGTPSAANRAVYSEVAATLRELGATVVTNDASGGSDQGFSASASSGIVLSYDFKKDMNGYLSTLAPDFPIKTLADIIQYNSDHADAALRFGQTTLVSSNNRDLEAQRETYEANKATGFANARQNGIDRILRENELDALFTIGGGTTGIAAVAGYPTVSVPAGYNSNAPDSSSWACVNVGFTGTAYSEAQLISMAYAYEQASRKRTPPGMAVKDDLKALIAQVDALSDTTKGLAAVELGAAQAASAGNFSTQKDVDEALWVLREAVDSCVFSHDGAKLTALNADRVTFSRGLLNDADTAKSLTLYAAIYDAGGRLVSLGMVSKTVAAGELTDFVVTVDVPAAGASAGAYLWDDTLTPVTEKATLGAGGS